MMRDQFKYEQEKLDKRISSEHRQARADGLLSPLPNSTAYQRKSTREARLAEQEFLLKLLSDWEKQQSEGRDKSTN